MRFSLLGAGALALITIVACDDPAGPTITRIELNSPVITFNALGQTSRLVARALDQDGNELPGVVLSWSSFDPTVASLSPDGTVTAERAGTTAIWVRSGTTSARVPVVVQQIPATIVSTGGAGQRGGVDSFLPAPLSVVVRDSLGAAVPGTRVEWRGPLGGTPEAAFTMTDASGVAQVRWRLTHTAGRDSAVAVIGDLPPVAFRLSSLPVLREISPALFAVGDEIILRGKGLFGAGVAIGGQAALVHRAYTDSLRVHVPEGLPGCTTPFPTVSISIQIRGVSTDTTVATYGTPIEGPVVSGAHYVGSPAVSGGCPIRLSAGSYAVAVFTTAPTTDQAGNPFQDEITRHQVFVSGSGPRSVRGVQVPRPSSVGAEPHDRTTNLRIGGAPAAVCMRAPLTEGRTIRIVDRVAGGGMAPVEFRVARVTAHFQLLVPAALYDPMSSTDKGRIASLADSAEVRVHPFLTDLFGALPDHDGTGRLTVLMSSGLSYAGPDRYADGGCASGNFVNMGAPEEWLITTAWNAGTVTSFLRLLVHEATHWIDFADAREPPYWSVEGMAHLTMYLWWYRQLGIDLWTTKVPISSRTGPPSNLVLAHNCYPTTGYYGARQPGQPWAWTGYDVGCGLLRYLVDQRRMEGADATEMMRRLLTASSRGDLRPIWEHLGGSGRSEAELQGEFLLMHYASDYVSGISTRLVNRSFDLRDLGPEPDIVPAFRFPMQTVDAGAGVELFFDLKRPDGYVVELTDVREGSLLRLKPAPGLSIAILKR